MAPTLYSLRANTQHCMILMPHGCCNETNYIWLQHTFYALVYKQAENVPSETILLNLPTMQEIVHMTNRYGSRKNIITQAANALNALTLPKQGVDHVMMMVSMDIYLTHIYPLRYYFADWKFTLALYRMANDDQIEESVLHDRLLFDERSDVESFAKSSSPSDVPDNAQHLTARQFRLFVIRDTPQIGTVIGWFDNFILFSSTDVPRQYKEFAESMSCCQAEGLYDMVRKLAPIILV